MKIKNALILLLLVCWGVSACAGNDQWVGTYAYEASLGETVAGEEAVVAYTLVVGAGTCKISIEGFQVSESIICKAADAGSNLDVKFQSYDNGSVANKYGVVVYKENSSLLRLERGKELITTWGELLPDESLAKTGKYFKKLK
ncbi:MAG TPA: DUF5991 domain-containing protein [Cellvibrio sp.]|nr:DUF5991 domain-containing protein [Cellvibrio sp.]